METTHTWQNQGPRLYQSNSQMESHRPISLANRFYCVARLRVKTT